MGYSMAKPILSFISAVYNKADVLAETLACLRTQRGFSVNELEFVFVDDKSTDGSLEFLQKEAEQDSRVTVISDGKNMGPAIRFNQAAKAAKGNWVLALDADDILPVNAAQVMLNECLTNEAQLVFGKSKRSLDVVRSLMMRMFSDLPILLPSLPGKKSCAWAFWRSARFGWKLVGLMRVSSFRINPCRFV
ncbi:MAG TPA: hypothetical protein DCS30_05750 [Rhizobiales bacterium]|nr:hypothetical protein [Hyphomicrobiales bacterium]